MESKLSDGLNQLELGEHLIINDYEHWEGIPHILGNNIKIDSHPYEKYSFTGECHKHNQTYKITIKVNTYKDKRTEVWMYRELTSPVKLRNYHHAVWWDNEGKLIYGKYYRKR